MTTTRILVLDGESLTPERLAEFSKLADNPTEKFEIKISPEGIKKIQTSEAFVKKILQSDEPVYGINTGFGKFAEIKISSEDLNSLQETIIRSHACGVGDPLPRSMVLGQWIARLNVFARGHSGISLSTVEKIIEFLHLGFLADVPSRGSVGASGDLCPSAHAVLAYLGEGPCTYVKDEEIIRGSASEALKFLNKKTLKLSPKEGLALINGTQLTTVLATFAHIELAQLVKVANLSLSLMVEGLRSTHRIFYEKTLAAKNQPGVKAVGEDIRMWLGNESEISQSHAHCGRVQDNYSLRCAPLVHGAIWDEVRQSEQILLGELNSSTDNPLLFPETEESVFGR